MSKARFTASITKQQRRERILFKMAEASPYGKAGKGKDKQGAGKGKVLQQNHDAPALRFEDSEPLPYSDPLSHYHISSSTRYHINIYNWLGRHARDDLALKVNFLLWNFIKSKSINHNTRTFYLD